jgi:hypothetical protein
LGPNYLANQTNSESNADADGEGGTGGPPPPPANFERAPGAGGSLLLKPSIETCCYGEGSREGEQKERLGKKFSRRSELKVKRSGSGLPVYHYSIVVLQLAYYDRCRIDISATGPFARFRFRSLLFPFYSHSSHPPPSLPDDGFDSSERKPLQFIADDPPRRNCTVLGPGPVGGRRESSTLQ